MFLYILESTVMGDGIDRTITTLLMSHEMLLFFLS